MIVEADRDDEDEDEEDKKNDDNFTDFQIKLEEEDKEPFDIA